MSFRGETMKRAGMKRFSAFVVAVLVVALLSPSMLYSVHATASEGNSDIAVETKAPESKETEAPKETKAASEKKSTKAKETKAAEPKTEETKAVETKATEAKVTEPKAAETKATEAKAAETKAAETKATEAKTTETKASESKETQSETKPSKETEETKATETAAPSETEAPETAAPSETTAETSAETKEQAPSETSKNTETSETSETTDAAEPSEPAETSESSESSEETTAPSEETSETSESSESSETSETETAPASNITIAADAEQFLKLVASLPAKYRLIIDTNKDLSSLKGASGVFYDGSYVLVFDGIENYSNAVNYLDRNDISYSIDGSVELCGGKFIANDVKVNPNAKTKVAIIDTGSSLANEKISVVGDNGADKNGHGTAMASNVLAQSDDAYIISIKAIDDNGDGKVADVYAALQYAIDAKCDVILMAISLRDLGQYDAFKSLVKEAVSKGIKVVASAGNNGTDASKYIPAGIKGVITAGAMDDKGVKLPKSNYGSAVDYYIVASSTSEAASILAGKVVANDLDGLATTCQMKASTGKDDNGKRFRINSLDDFTLDHSAAQLFHSANGFCVFVENYTHSNHMEGTVAADTLIRNCNDVMDLSLSNLIYQNAQGQFYFYFNKISTKPNLVSKELFKQNSLGKAPFYLGTDLLHVRPEKIDDNHYKITINGNEIPLTPAEAGNGKAEFIVSKSTGEILVKGQEVGDITNGASITQASNTINFAKVLEKIGGWSEKFYSKDDLRFSDGQLINGKLTFYLHKGVNYIDLTEDQLNSSAFNFVSPANSEASVIINVIDTAANGKGTVIINRSDANMLCYNSVGSPEKTSETLSAAKHIMFNFDKDIENVRFLGAASGQLGTILAPGSNVYIESTHDGSVVAKGFENDGKQIHQAGFAGFANDVDTFNSLTVSKKYYYTNTTDSAAHTGNAKFKLTGTDGFSEEHDSGYVWKNLHIGTYTLTETSVPDGFTGIQPLTVTVDDHWKITVTDPNNQSAVTLPTGTDFDVSVSVNNYTDHTPTEVKFSKKVMGGGSDELTGASMKLSSTDAGI